MSFFVYVCMCVKYQYMHACVFPDNETINIYKQNVGDRCIFTGDNWKCWRQKPTKWRDLTPDCSLSSHTSYVQTGSIAVEQVSRWFFTELPLLSMLYRLRKYVLNWKGADARYLKMQFSNPHSIRVWGWKLGDSARVCKRRTEQNRIMDVCSYIQEYFGFYCGWRFLN